MPIADYTPPVSQLFTYEKPSENFDDWSGYLNLGVTSEHIPELIQLLGDQFLYSEEAEDQDWNAPIHAWRILGQLKAEAAIEPLIDVIRQWGDDLNWAEWMIEEIPRVFGQIGAAALPALTDYLADSTQPDYCLETVISSITKIGLDHPEQRESCVAILSHELEGYADRDPSLNAYLVTSLVADFKAVEAAPLIEAAFNANKVDEAFIGDWDEAQVYLGLKTREEVPRKQFLPVFGSIPRSAAYEFDRNPSGFGSRGTSKTKVKRKQQKEARRKNRSKKKK